MQFSLLSLLSLAPVLPTGKGDVAEGFASEGGAASDLFSFDQWLADNGISVDQLPKELGDIPMDWFGDSVSNLVLAQGDAGLDALAENPAQFLAMLNVNTAAGLKQLAQITLTPSQAAQIADKIGQFLQRPDTAAELNEQQRMALAGMLSHFRQAAKSEVPQPIAPAVESLDKAIPAHAGNTKERMPVLGQVMKWLQHVLREARQQTAMQQPVADTAEASSEEVAPLGFPVGAGLGEETPPETQGQGQAETLNDEDASALLAALLAPPKPVEQATPVTQDAEALPEVALPSLSAPREEEGEAMKGMLADAAMDVAAEAGDADRVSDVPEVLPALSRQELDSGKRELGGLKPVKPFEMAMDAQGVARPEATQTAQAVTAPVQAQLMQPMTGHGGHGVSASAHAPATHVPESQYGAVSQQVQVGIKQIAQGGIERITIRLTPEDMGRVDVRMDVGADGRAHIVFTADKADALDQMQRDARMLERALQDAGVKADAGSMEFNLRQQNQHAAAMQDGGGQQDRSAEPQWEEGEAAASVNGAVEEETAIADADGAIRQYQVNMATGLDIRV